ncbi:MAG: ABC transporter ATP-binding protein [Clostridia bacterium]|nr:ABC transporter ATP-binding protein [Clostridia bacterium]
MAYIHFEHINKYFGTNHVLKDITLDIEQGELVTFLGPSGCGKSTLLRCLSGLEEVTSGKIFLDGKDVTEVSPRKRGCGMVFQQYSLFPNMTVAQNVAFGLKMQKMPKAQIETKVREMLDVVGLSEKYDQYPRSLSGGQQQRVALARALVVEPKVLLLDEPLSAIDALLRKNLQIEIRRIQRDLGITTLFVTHDQDEAMVMSDKIHLFNMGTIEQSASPVDMYTKPASKYAASFIGHYNILQADAFNKAAGTEYSSGCLAFRPEIIGISRTEPEEEAIVIKGTVRNQIPHGNIVRYTIDANGVELDADILFEASSIFEIGEQVYVSIKDGNILELE